MSNIGVLREGPLHAAVKAFLARSGDRAEVQVSRFVIDLVRADGELVEVQTGGFSALGPKLDALLDEHRFRIVYPVAAERRIVRVDEHGEIISVRRSPKHAGVVDVFERLVAQRAVYCLRMMGVVEAAAKRGRTPLHQVRERSLAGTARLA